MSVAARLRQWRDWAPVPVNGMRPRLIRWTLLEGRRLAVTGVLLTIVYVTIMLLGTVFTFEMQELLTETSTVENLLDTFLSGIILLVSIVVSTNSIILSHDIASVGTQEDRIDSAMQFRQNIGKLTETGESPTDPSSFSRLLSGVINEQVARFETAADDADPEVVEAVREYTTTIERTVDRLGVVDTASGAEFGVLWLGLEFKYGTQLDRSRILRGSYGDQLSDTASEELDELIRTLELFAVGKE